MLWGQLVFGLPYLRYEDDHRPSASYRSHASFQSLNQLEITISQGSDCGVVVRSYFAAHNYDFLIPQRAQARLRDGA
jgi:hypothetical protein